MEREGEEKNFLLGLESSQNRHIPVLEKQMLLHSLELGRDSHACSIHCAACVLPVVPSLSF